MAAKQKSASLPPEERTCVPFSRFLAVSTEQIKKQLRLEIVLGRVRWHAKQTRAEDLRKSVSQAIPGLTTGILDSVSSKEWALGSKGSWQGNHRRPHQPAPGSGPAITANLQPSSRPWPRPGAPGSPSSAGAHPQARGLAAAPGIPQPRGYRQAPASRLCRAPAASSSFPLASGRSHS